MGQSESTKRTLAGFEAFKRDKEKWEIQRLRAKPARERWIHIGSGSPEGLVASGARTDTMKDWADIEQILGVEGQGGLDLQGVAERLARTLGPDDDRIRRLQALASETWDRTRHVHGERAPLAGRP